MPEMSRDEAAALYDRTLREMPGYDDWVASRRAARRKRERREAFWQAVKSTFGLAPRRDMSPQARRQRAADGIKHDHGDLT